MLTKDLLKHRRRGDRIHPTFVDPDDRAAQDMAAGLCSIAEDSLGQVVGEFEQETQDISRQHPHGPGLRKILLDQCELSDVDDSIEDTRWKAVFAAQKMRAEFSEGENAPAVEAEISDYRQRVATGFGLEAEQLTDNLYGDLAALRPIAGFKHSDPTWLLHRYNVAQVQGLLLKARRIEVRVQGASTSAKRALFRKLKFHRLLCDVALSPKDLESKKADLKFTISGPLSIFQQAQTYGMRLANFFPVLLHLDKWQLTADIKLANRDVVLKLSEKQKLVSHYKWQEQYIPPELQACIDSVPKAMPGWMGRPGESFFDLGRQSYYFPDLTLEKDEEHDQGGEGLIHVELFHRWHKGPFLDRLGALERYISADSSERKASPSTQGMLFLGVAPEVLREKQVQEITAQSETFSKFCFTFRQMPTAKAFKEILKNFGKYQI